MDWVKSLKSLIVPWHNEWLVTWLYIGFTLYFWIEVLLIMLHDRQSYDFVHHKDYEFMYIATMGIAVSLTLTTVFHIFYS